MSKHPWKKKEHLRSLQLYRNSKHHACLWHAPAVPIPAHTGVALAQAHMPHAWSVASVALSSNGCRRRAR